MLFGMFCPGPAELLIVGVVLCVLIAPKAMPKVARSIGSVLPEFKKGLNDVKELKDEVSREIDDVKNTTKEALS